MWIQKAYHVTEYPVFTGFLLEAPTTMSFEHAPVTKGVLRQDTIIELADITE